MPFEQNRLIQAKIADFKWVLASLQSEEAKIAEENSNARDASGKNDLAAKLEQIKNLIAEQKIIIADHEAELEENLKNRYMVEFNSGESTLLHDIADILNLDLTAITDAERQRIYEAADRALVVSTAMNVNNTVDLIEFWRVINFARNIALNDFRQDPQNPEFIAKKAKYLVGSRKLLGKLIQYLPPGMQLLKIFFALGDYAAIERYLHEFNSAEHNPQRYEELVRNLVIEVEQANHARAEQYLAKRAGSEDLPLDQEVAEEFIKQRKYVQRIRAVLSFDEYNVDDPLRKVFYALTQRVEENIKAGLLHDRSLFAVKEDFATIQSTIASHETQMMKRIFMERLKGRTNTTVAGLGIVGWLFAGTAMPAAALAYLAATSAYESTKLMESEELMAAKKLAQELDPVDYMFLTEEVDKLWNKHAAKPIRDMKISGDSLPAHIKARAEQYSKDKIITPIKNSLLEEAEPYTDKAFKLIAALFTITIASLLNGLLVLTVIFPPIWPVWVAIGVSSAIGLAIWQITVPGSMIAEKLMRIASGLNFNVGLIYNALLSPWRSFTNFIKQGRIFSALATVVVGVVFGVVAAALLPIVTSVVLATTILGTTAGVILRKGIGEILDNLFTKPWNIIRTLNQASAIAKKKRMNFTREEVAYVDSIFPTYKGMKFSQLTNAFFQDRFNELEQKLAKAAGKADQDEVKLLAAQVNELEDRCDKITALIALQVVLKDKPEDQRKRVLTTMKNYFYDFLGPEYEMERVRFIEACAARKQKQDVARAKIVVQNADAKEAVKMPKYVEEKLGKMKFSKEETARLKQAEQILGAAPQYEMKFAVDYAAERARLEQLSGIKAVLDQVRLTP